MDDRIDTLDAMLDATATLVAEIGDDELDRPTPCAELDVDGVIDHLTVWVQVFAGAADDTPVAFDPFTHHATGDRPATFAAAGRQLVAGLRAHGVDRPMTMTADPLPGQLVLHMVLSEYVGHGWDLARATGRPVPFDDHQAAVALDSARAIIRPEYRETGMFGPEVDVADDAPVLDRFVAFLGRDPAWRPPA